MTQGPFDNPMGLMGFEFVEFASPTPGLVEPPFEQMGFSLVAAAHARHPARRQHRRRRETPAAADLQPHAARPGVLRVHPAQGRRGLRLDDELELGVFIGQPNAQGEAIPMTQAEQHVFGLALFNDWSARDLCRPGSTSRWGRSCRRTSPAPSRRGS